MYVWIVDGCSQLIDSAVLAYIERLPDADGSGTAAWHRQRAESAR